MLKIEQLNLPKYNVPCDEQQKVCGGRLSSEELWSGYADGSFYISTSNGYRNRNGGDYVVFSELRTIGDGSDEDLVDVGAINISTGKLFSRGSGGNLD